MSLIENKSLTLAENELFTRAVSVVSTQLNTKARLSTVVETFDPNAIDGDGDGIVQDGSPFERPAVISSIIEGAQRLANIINKATRLNKQGRAKEYNRRYSGMSAKDIAKDTVPTNFNEWAALTYQKLRVIDPYLPELNSETTPQDIKEIARQLEKFVETDLLWMLSTEAAEKYKANKLIDKNKAFSELVDKSFDFSPKTVAKNRALVEHVLTTNPQFRELVNKLGMPPIFGFGEGMDDSHMANGFFSEQIGMGLRQFTKPKSQGRKFDPTYRTIGKWWMNGIMPPDVGSKKTKRWTTRAGSPESLLIHEYGHYISDALNPELTDLDKDQRTQKWQAWRFSIGSKWQEVFDDIGSPEWYEKYKLPDDKERSVIPDEIPHIETAYGESSPTEAFAESISAMFAHNGEDQNLVSQGMKELIADLLSLDPKRDIREQLTPTRIARQIIPDGFASRGAVVEINKEKDARFGEITDPYELTAEVLGTLNGEDPVGQMVRRLQEMKDNPTAINGWDWWVGKGREWEIEQALNMRVANEKESQLIASIFLNDPAFADMIRRHGMAQIYFSQTDLVSGKDRHDVRGVLTGGFHPNDSETGHYWPPHIKIDLIGAEHERNLRDQPMGAVSTEKMKAYSKGKAPGSVTRTHLSRSDQHVVRHESGHAIHDNLWEKQHRGEITGRRATLIRAYSKSTWEEFYKEIGRPDLWRDHQRAIRATYDDSVINNALRRFLPGSTTASPEIGQVDSAYAWVNPKEMFAESFSAYTSSNSAYRGLLNDTMIDHLQSILGDADTDQPGYYGNPPALVDEPKVDIPEPPAWEGFASTGEPIKSYKQLRRDYVDNIADDETFSRSKFFQNTTTDQKIDLAVPADENEWALMAWDLMFENLQIKGEVIKRIDFSDPFNPTLENDRDTITGGKKFFGGFVTFGGYNLAETLDVLEYQGFLLKRDKPDFSPDIVKANRDAIRSTLDAFPRFRAISEQLGLPPITAMSASHQERIGIETELERILQEWKSGAQLTEKFDAVMMPFMKYTQGDSGWNEFIKNQAVKDLLAEWKPEVDNVGGFYSPSRTISIGRSQLNGFIDGTRVDHEFAPTAGDWLVAGNNLESTILHEYGHYIDNTLYNRGKDGKKINNDIDKLFENVADHIKTEYGRTARNEFVAEIAAAVLSGSRDQEEMLSPEARQLARQIAGLPERDPVFAGRTSVQPDSGIVADRFGELWQRSTAGLMEPLDKERGIRSRDGVPDVLETMMDAKLRTGLSEFAPVEFEHSGRTFAIREVGDTFEIEINSRTVARANVTPGKDGLPEIDNVDVLPGYTGVAPDKDLYEMIVDHARKKYPSARAPRRARKAEVVSEGFASVGPEHHDARGIDGTPGTPEYTQAIASELAAAQAEGKKVFFDYNGETREVEVVEIFEKNGFTYMKGNDALRDGAERMFRLDRVSMPKRVENLETGKAEIAKLPGKKPRRPVPIFTGKAAEIFEGAESWEDVAARLGKGRFVFFDFETTGIEENPYSVDYNHPGTPTQIGLVEIIDGKITRRWATHVNPGRPMSIDPKTGRSWSADNLKYKDPVTGELVNLTDEWLAQQKPLNEALEEMLEFIGPIEDTILGGQNHPYDDDVMKRAMADTGIDPARWNPGGFIDSQALAQSLLDKDSEDYPRDPLKGYKTVSLGPLATWLGHDMGGGWHSADADSEASYEAFKRLVDRAALQEGQGIPVRRDILSPGGGEKELQERLRGFEKEKSGFDWKVKKYQDQQSAPPDSPATEGFASRGQSNDDLPQSPTQAADDYIDALANMPDPKPKSRVKGVKPKKKGYRAAGTGNGWTSVEDHINIETERGNELFETHKEYLDKGYEVAWVTHNPKDAGRYAISADQVNAFDRDEISVDPANIDPVDLTGSELVGSDGEGGFLYARQKPSPAARKLRRVIEREEELLDQYETDGFASTGNKPNDGFASWAIDTGGDKLEIILTGNNIESKIRGGSKQRDQEVVDDDWNTRQQKRIAGVRIPEYENDENNTPMPSSPVYRETIKIARKKYTFEVDSNGIVSVYTGRKYKQVAQLTLDRNHSHIGGRSENKNRHYIDGITVNEKHRRRGIATEMSRLAEQVYGGRVEHSTALSAAGEAWRNADVERRGTPAAPIPGDGFASRGSITLNRAAKRIAEREAAKSPSQMIGEKYLNARLDGYDKFGGNVSNAELNMLAIYKSWQESNEPWESFVERFPALQSLIKHEESRLERAATISILEEMITARRGPQPAMTGGQREGTIRRVNNPQIGAANLMAESVLDTQRLKQQQRDLEIQKNYLAWKRSGDTWEKFIEDNPAIEKLVEKERSSGKINERIIRILPGAETSPLLNAESDGFASRGESGLFNPPSLDAGSSADFSLDELADKLNLDEVGTGPDRVMGQLTGQINQRIANGEATLAEKLGITPEQLQERLADAATEINQFVDRFVHDKKVRENIKHGFKILSAASIMLGSAKMKELLSLINPNLSGGGDGSGQSSSLIDLVDVVLSAGIHEALIAYGSNFANLIATELAAMRLVTRQKAKEMIEEIKKRIEGTGQYIGTMSNEMWARLRGAWSKVRPTAPIGVPAAAKQWIVAGSSPQWAEMSWMDYQSKNRLSRDLIPTDTQRWAKIAVKVGQSPELIDIASYRAGIGYGDKRIKSRDVIRVYTTTG